MNSPTDMNQFEHLRKTLAWGEQILRQQPEDLCSEYHHAGQKIAAVLTQSTYSATIQLPCRIRDSKMQSVSPSLTKLHIGNVVSRLLHKSCQTTCLHQIKTLSEQKNPIVSKIARLTCYLAAQIILTSTPSQAVLHADYVLFDKCGSRVKDPDTDADALIDQLSRHMDWLHTAEQLYPAWTTHDLYNNASATLTAHLIEQGRALANYYTQQIISDVRQEWYTGKLTRGLTLFIPYLDERLYRMRKYTVVVIPTGRILFRPEFVIGACRLAEQEVRKNRELSQSTRWQLLSQLDSISQAFEIETRSSR